MEIYQESKHGILYAANKDKLAMHKDSWVVGKDYTAAPTCTTCHMGATPSHASTHDVGARISWTLRPVVSKKLENADKRRDAMKDVCSNCHAGPLVDGFYKQFDGLVNLYAWWHGIYDVAKNFYTESLPEAKRVAGPEVYNELAKKYLEPDVRHEWYLKGMSKEQLEKIKKYYQERYGKENAAE